MRIRLVAVVAATMVCLGAPVPARAAPDADGLTPVAGTGTAGFSGDDGPASAAALNAPYGVAVGPDGTLYVADTGNHRVRAVGADGTIRTVAGTGESGTRGDPVPQGAKATDVALGLPTDLAVSSDGTVYFVDAMTVRVYALAKDGTLTVRAGAGRISAAGKTVGERIGGIALGAGGAVYLADTDNARVLAIAMDGTATVVAGNGGATVTAAGGPAAQTAIGPPNSVAVDVNGDLWVSGGLLLHRLHAGALGTVTKSGDDAWAVAEQAQWPPSVPPLNNVEKVSAGSDGPYAFDRKDKTVYRLGPGGQVTTAAKLTDPAFADLGQVQLAAASAPAGPLYLVDTGHHRVYRATVAVAADQPAAAGKKAPWWPYAIAGAVLIALLVGVLVGRRRRNG